MSNGTNLTLSSDVDQDSYWKVTKMPENTRHNIANRSALFTAGDHKAVRNRQGSITKTQLKHYTE